MPSNEVQYTLSLRDLLSDKLKGANVSANKLEGGLRRAQMAASSLGSAIGITFGLAGVAMFVKKVVDAGAQVEMARIGLTTLTGDANIAANVIKETMKDAAKTPFDFKSLLEVRRTLISTGIDANTAREDMLNLANAVASTGGGNDELSRMSANLMQIKNVGKATAMDIRQFGYAGINIYTAIAKATGKTTQELQGMQFTYEDITFALKKAHEEGGIYYNGLENAMGSTAQKMSNISDSIFTTMVAIYEKTQPILNYFIDGIGNSLLNVQLKLQDIDFAKISESALKAFKSIEDYIAPIIVSIKSFFNNVWQGYSKMMASLSQFSGQAKSIMLWLQTTFIDVINVMGILYKNIYSFLAGVIDVAHTLYVILEKLYIIKIIAGIFGVVWNIIKGIAIVLNEIYENTLKKLFDKIGVVYDKVKELLGIKSFEIKGQVGGINDAVNKTKESPDDKTDKNKTNKNLSIPNLKDQTKGAQGQKAVTINIKIQDLVKELSINTVNMKEGAGKLREMIAETLMSAVNDSQLISGQ
jgi:tape measure domain-containing protein